MSATERDWAFLIRQTADPGLSQREAAERPGIGVRQFKRLGRRWKESGDAGLMWRRRGRSSHNRFGIETYGSCQTAYCLRRPRA